MNANIGWQRIAIYLRFLDGTRRLITDLGLEPRQRDNWYRLVK